MSMMVPGERRNPVAPRKPKARKRTCGLTHPAMQCGISVADPTAIAQIRNNVRIAVILGGKVKNIDDSQIGELH
jgi:nitrous oxidase accessory protein NosD